MEITFHADKVKVKTGAVDNSAQVTFTVGEYQLENIKELIGVIDKDIEVMVKTSQ